jgi:hypothetical protein
MNALSKADSLKQQFPISDDAYPPASAGSRKQNGVEFVSQERMSILGLEGPGLALAPPTGTARRREAFNALLKRWNVITQPLLALMVGMRVPLQRMQPVLIERWMAAVVRMQRALHVLLERWMAANFRTRQLPILAIVAAIWVSTSWMAGRADDSATPLLRQMPAATKSQPVHLGDRAGGEASQRISEPVAARPESLTELTSPSLSLNQIVKFLISGTTPQHARLTNPQLQVWADTHTGLYYCPGDDGYRRRSRGHFMSQREAQNNYFQPASGATCR